MNQTARRALCAFVLGAGTLLTLSQVWGQTLGPQAGDDAPKPPQPPAALPAPPEGPEPIDGPGPGATFGGGGFDFGRGLGGFGGRHRNRRLSEAEIKDFEGLRQATGKLKAAKNDAEKTALTKEISQRLDKSFEHDMQRREKEIADVEARVKKLRDQIEKRKKAKDDIISLRLKTIVNEADGLGFPEGADARPGFSWQRDDFRHIGAMPFSFENNDLEPPQGDAPKAAPGEPAENESR
jgi:hypothetical protein